MIWSLTVFVFRKMSAGALLRAVGVSLSLLLPVVFSSEALSRALVERHVSVRALGMGNAYTALVSDGDSLFYNPAGLRRVKGLNWKIFETQLGANGLKVMEAVDEFSQDGADLAESIRTLYGENYWFHMDFKSLLTLPGFGGGVFGTADLEMVLDNPVYTNLNISAIADYGLIFGFAVPVVPDLVDAGLVVKRIQRMGSSFPVGPSVLGNFESDDIMDEISKEGVGYSLDLGVNFRLPSPLNPTLSAVWKNAGRTTFRPKSGSVAPPSDEEEIILGAALEIEGPLFTVSPAIDYKYSNWTGVQLGKKLHMGVELSLPVVDARAGLHQGYYTLGAGVNLGLVRLDAATYGVELGVYPGQLEDRRYILELSMELGFNPSFDFSGSSGGSSSGRIKQRR